MCSAHVACMCVLTRHSTGTCTLADSQGCSGHHFADVFSAYLQYEYSTTPLLYRIHVYRYMYKHTSCTAVPVQLLEYSSYM